MNNRVTELETLITKYQQAFHDDEMTDEEFDVIWDELKKNPHSDHPLVQKLAYYSWSEPCFALQAQTIQAEPFWENIDHKDPEQIKRQKYARNDNRITIISINRESKKGVFQGTSWTKYKVSLKNCTCADFE